MDGYSTELSLIAASNTLVNNLAQKEVCSYLINKQGSYK